MPANSLETNIAALTDYLDGNEKVDRRTAAKSMADAVLEFDEDDDFSEEGSLATAYDAALNVCKLYVEQLPVVECLPEFDKPVNIKFGSVMMCRSKHRSRAFPDHAILLSNDNNTSVRQITEMMAYDKARDPAVGAWRMNLMSVPIPDNQPAQENVNPIPIIGCGWEWRPTGPRRAA